ncbi:helix-turn-helix transcriptional regulator [Dietzia sp. WMMA184]|uniref:helix-turn-helix transcriptional regulator n=1 Tax=Dietzia sp. WMMA184 TaxID=2039808 RepID=UPI000BDF8557|nr:helix-turn-helix transcriptional regulator [Dietzia sp. WMMA184]
MTLEQIAADLGIHPMTLNKWIRKTDAEARVKPGTTAALAIAGDLGVGLSRLYRALQRQN